MAVEEENLKVTKALEKIKNRLLVFSGKGASERALWQQISPLLLPRKD